MSQSRDKTNNKRRGKTLEGLTLHSSTPPWQTPAQGTIYSHSHSRNVSISLLQKNSRKFSHIKEKKKNLTLPQEIA